MQNKNHKISFVTLFFLVFVFLVSQIDIAKTVAQSSATNLSGYAWSENIGWVSFASSTNANNVVSVGTDDYVTGYAWSENIGWVKFGGLSSFPSGGGTISDNAKISGNNLIGWARACAGTVNGNCASMDSRADGWDGWIKLDGVILDGTQTYAWGSDVVGWIDFSQVTLTNSDVCSNIPGNQTSLPANTELSAGACTCLTSTPPGQLSQNVLNGGCTCLNGGAWNGTTCVQVCTATTLITKVSPAFVATPSDVCTLTWDVSNYQNGGDNGVCPLRSVSCVFDGTTDVTNASSTGVSMPIGTHSLVCGDGYATSTKSVKCKLSPNYGEF